VAQYRAHTDETLGYLDQYLYEFHQYKDVFKPFRISKKTRKAAATLKASKTKELGEKHKAENLVDGIQATQAQIRNRLQDDGREVTTAVDDFIAAETHFSFVKIHLLAHYAYGIRRSGELVQQSTEYSELMHSIQQKHPYSRSNRGVDFEQQMLDDYNRIHCFRIRRLTLLQLAREDHYTPEIQRVLGLYREKDRNRVSRYLCEGNPLPEPDTLPLFIPSGQSELTRRRVRSRTAQNSYVRNDPLLGYNYPLSEYIIRFYERQFGRTDLTTESVHGWQAHSFKVLDIPVAMFQSYGGQDSVVHSIRCTGDEKYRGKVRNDYVWVNCAKSNGIQSDLGTLVPGRMVKLYTIIDEDGKKLVALVKLLHPENGGNVDPRMGLIRVTDRDCRPNSEDLHMVLVKSIWSVAHLIPIPATRSFYVNSTIDLKMFNSFYSRKDCAQEDIPALYCDSGCSEDDSTEGETSDGSDGDFPG